MSTYMDNARRFEKGQSIDPASYTATKTGDEIDITGAVKGSVWVVVDVGAVTTADASNYFTFTVTEAPTTGGSFDSTNITYDAADSWDRVINATTEANTSYAFNVFTTEPFIKVVATETATAQAIFGANVFWEKRKGPANT